MLQTLLLLGTVLGAIDVAATTAAVTPVRSSAPAATAVVDSHERGDARHARDDRQDEGRGRWVVVEGERSVQTFKVGDAGSLRISNLAGDIVITGGSGGEIRVQAVKHGKGRADGDARQELGRLDVDIRQVGSRVEIETTHQRHSRGWVDYTIVVPSGTTVDAKTVSGDIRLSTVQGEVRAESVSGDVSATSLPRVASLKSVSGTVEATTIASETDAVLSSVSGDVIVKGLKSRGATVETVSGSVAIKACACTQASAQSVSGNIEYAGTLQKGGRYEFRTHSGDVLLVSPGDGFELEASTFSGNVQNDLPLTTRSGESSMDRRRGPGRFVKAVVGNGGAFVEIKTFSGSIRLTKG